MNNEVLEFIKRRFNNNYCKWTDGNCYYFAVILKDRFPDGKIYYNTLQGHFVFHHNGIYYDWNGIFDDTQHNIAWDTFEEYDSMVKTRIIRDCLM